MALVRLVTKYLMFDIQTVHKKQRYIRFFTVVYKYNGIEKLQRIHKKP